METFVQQNMPFFLSFLQLMGESDTIKPDDNILERIEKNQAYWSSFLEEQKKHCQKSMQLFRSYDIKNRLKSFWICFQLGRSWPIKKTLTLLSEYANQAEESGNFEDAFHMFSFIALLYPRNYVLYVKVCQLAEQLYGLEAAAQLYKMATYLFEQPDLLFLAAECEARGGHWEQAKAYVTKALEIFEKRPPSTPQEMEFKADLKELLVLTEKACA